MSLILLSFHQIQAKNGSHMEGILASIIGSSHALEQTQDDMGKV